MIGADLHQAQVLAVQPVGAITATGNGTAIDIRNFIGPIAVVLDSAAGTGTSPTLDARLQQSPDGSTGWTDIPGASFAQVTNAAVSRQKVMIDKDSVQGFIRLARTVGGTSPSFTASVTALAVPKYG